MASNYKFTPQQKSRFDSYHNQQKILRQETDGAFLIDLYGEQFYVTPAGRVLYPRDYERGKPKQIHFGASLPTVSITPKKPEKKKPDAKKEQPAYGDYSAIGTWSYKPTASTASSWKSFCQLQPECCKPRDVQIVAWDADHTIWNMGVTAAGVTGPLKKIDADTVVELNHPSTPSKSAIKPKDELEELELQLLEGLSDQEKTEYLGVKAEADRAPVEGKDYRTVIKLFPTFRQTLDELDKRKIPSVIISLNTPGSVKRILKEFGLDHRFAEIRDSYENKGKVYNEITRKMGICPCSGVFVDDNLTNIRDVSEKQGMALLIGKTGDIQEPLEVLKYIKE